MEKMVVESLLGNNREAQIQAAMELSKLTSKQRQKLAERVVSPLVSLLHSRDYQATEAALIALLSLAFGSERNKIRIMKAGALPALLELLQCPSGELTELAVAAMLILSSCTANKPAIASSGALQFLVEILNAEYVDETGMISITMQSKLDATSTIHNLSTCQQIVPLIISSGVIFALLQLIQDHEKSSEMAEKAMAALECIVRSSGDALQEASCTTGAIRALVEAVEEGSPQCKENAVGILLLLCKSCRERHRGMILREGVMPGLLQLSVDGTWKAKDAARELLLLLRDRSSNSPRSLQLKHELLEQIMNEIDAEEGEEVAGPTLKLVEELIAKLST